MCYNYWYIKENKKNENLEYSYCNSKNSKTIVKL